MKIKDYKKIGEGLVHEIFLNDKKAYKIPKDNFKEFHNIKHFEIEKKTLDFLREIGLPSVKIIDIHNGEKPVLVEEFIDEGYQKEKGTLTELEILSLLGLLKKVHLIKLGGYGVMENNGTGPHKTWRNFIEESSGKNLNFLSENEIIGNDVIKKIRLIIKQLMGEIKFNGKGSLILTDINPMNFFFKDEKIFKIIDMDHPIIGDPLYEYASIKWYHEDIFKNYLDHEKPGEDVLKIIKVYEIIHALSILQWSFVNKLPMDENLFKLNSLLENFDN